MLPAIRTAVRTGDTPASERQRMVKHPPHILVTTPESLFILLTAERSRQALRTVRTVIVDEIHAMADDKRGAHLALSLARLDDLVEKAGGRGRSGSVCRRRSGRSRPSRASSRRTSTRSVTVINHGHRRAMDLAVEVPKRRARAGRLERDVAGDLRSGHRADPASTGRRSCSSTRGGWPSGWRTISPSGSAKTPCSPITAASRASCGSRPKSGSKAES